MADSVLGERTPCKENAFVDGCEMKVLLPGKERFLHAEATNIFHQVMDCRITLFLRRPNAQIKWPMHSNQNEMLYDPVAPIMDSMVSMYFMESMDSMESMENPWNPIHGIHGFHGIHGIHGFHRIPWDPYGIRGFHGDS